jgi:hypothetical protein
MPKTCQNCKNEFVIDQNDQDFYAKMDVPYPTFCPTCRFQRRLQFFNLHKLYARECSKCNKSIISMFHKDQPFNVFCNTCWWSDDWDGTEVAVDYDPTRNFFEQMIELKNKTNFMQLEALYPSLVRTEYTNNAAYQKDSFMTFFSDYSENCMYITMTAHVKDSVDCFRIKESENCYGCVGVFKCYNTFFSEECDSCFDILYSRNLSGCSNCIGSINLRNQSYMVFNKKYSKEEYLKLKDSFKLDTAEGHALFQQQAYEFFKKFPEREYKGNSLNLNVTGEYVYESKNTKDAYLVSSAEDSRYVSFLTLPKTTDAYDYTGWGNGASKIYECFIVGEGAYNVKYSAECWPEPVDLEYCYYAQQSKNCFGCVNIKKKQYCILNKQYSKEAYEALKSKIIESLKNDMPFISKQNNTQYRYGEFLPPDMSPYGYNETVAQDLLELTEQETEALGINWYAGDITNHTANNILINFPKEIKNTPDSICESIFACEACKNGYQIREQELFYLKKFNVPIPIHCYKCRQKNRLSRCNGFILRDSICARCACSIKTANQNNSIVYCEKCYQQEVV